MDPLLKGRGQGLRVFKKILFNLGNKNQQDVLFYSQFIAVINLYMFRAGLLFIIRGYLSVYTASGNVSR